MNTLRTIRKLENTLLVLLIATHGSLWPALLFLGGPWSKLFMDSLLVSQVALAVILVVWHSGGRLESTILSAVIIASLGLSYWVYCYHSEAQTLLWQVVVYLSTMLALATGWLRISGWRLVRHYTGEILPARLQWSLKSMMALTVLSAILIKLGILAAESTKTTGYTLPWLAATMVAALSSFTAIASFRAALQPGSKGWRIGMLSAALSAAGLMALIGHYIFQLPSETTFSLSILLAVCAAIIALSGAALRLCGFQLARIARAPAKTQIHISHSNNAIPQHQPAAALSA